MPNWKKVIISGSNAELNSIFSTGPITGSFFTGSFVGDGSALTGVSSPPFPFSGSAVITGSLTGQVLDITPATATASLDCLASNFFTLTLSSSYALRLEATNIQPGQAINLLITQPSPSGSLVVADNIKFASGYSYEPTPADSAQDIVSFISFDSASLYASSIPNLE